MAQIQKNNNLSQNINFGQLQKIKIKKGDTESINFNLKINNVPIDLSNKNLSIVLKNDITSLIPSLSKSLVIPNSVDAQNGKYVLVLSSLETNISSGLYYSEVQISTDDVPAVVLSSKIFCIEVETDLI